MKLAHHGIHRKRDKVLGTPELIAIALGGMIGGGIFSVLGVSVAMIGEWTPLAMALGGVIAGFAAYAYIKLGVYYQDEGATYSFMKKTFPGSPFAASLVGWWVIFGYISTLALYAYTFSAYAISAFAFDESEWVRKFLAGAVLAFFALVNVWSVKGMGKLEDLMVYTKLVILVVIAFVLINNSQTTLPKLISDAAADFNWVALVVMASMTFVAYEGFQLVINAVGEMDAPRRQIPTAIYSSIFLAALIYGVISIGAIVTIPFEEIIANQEFALAAGADKVLGHWGTDLVVLGAILATSSAISGTLFGASRQMAVIARDGYFPAFLATKSRGVPMAAIVSMSVLAFGLILVGSLQLILEFGSLTFLLVSVLMAYANFRIRHLTGSSAWVAWLAVAVLMVGLVSILYYEITTQPEQLIYIAGLYILLALLAFSYMKKVESI